MKAAKEFGTVLCLLAATLGIGYAAVTMLPGWCIAAYLIGLGIVGVLLWRNSK